MIGREWERKELLRRYERNKPEFIAVYGRRRVGKTFLIDNTLEKRITFRHAGLSPIDDQKAGEMNRQLEQFYYTLQRYHADVDHRPKDWLEAFFMLETWLEKVDDGSRQVVFLDELPWLDTPRSHFKSALESFWNNWGCHRNNLMFIVCGSASSWILDNLINNHGGLYNRLTCQMRLSPFSLRECEQFLEENQVHLSRYDIVQSYMILGGIPYYLDYFEPGLSLPQDIDKLFFAPNAVLKDEYDRLFSSVFSNPDTMKSIIAVLGKRREGYNRSDIAEMLEFRSGGTLTKCLNSLIESDFITKYVPFGESVAYYKLTDPFCLFFSYFMGKTRRMDHHYWSNNHNSATANSWRGLAFENVCFRHVDQIKKALDIYGVHTTHSAWLGYDEELGGAQIDLILDRDDHVINMCEIKYLSRDFTVNAAYQRRLSNREAIIQKMISRRQVIHHTLITTYGLTQNEYSGVFSKVITLEDLFLI